MKFAWTEETKRSPACIELAKRVEGWQQRLAPLGISHFMIDAVHVEEETPGGPLAKASVRVSHSYDHCTFWFRWDFLENCTSDELDQTILHEWMHVAMRNLDRALEAVEKWMPEATYSDFENVVDAEREGLVDRLAHTVFLAFKGRPARFST